MVINDGYGNQYEVEEKTKSLFDKIYLKGIESVITLPYLPAHDLTFVDDELWAFITTGTSNNLKIYNNEFNLVTQKTISMYFNSNPFKFKSVDYNKNIDCLMIGAGDGMDGVAEDCYLYMFYDAKNWKDISGTITLDNCGGYSVIDFSSFDYSDYSTYGFWVSDTEIIVTMGANVDIYLVQLGKGTVNLGNGVYTSTDSDKFNGTYKVIRKWTKGDYIDDEARDVDNPYTVHGGDYYNGNLFFANSNNRECSVYKVNLSNDGTYRIDIFDCVKYMEDSTLKKQYRFLDGLAISEDGYIYSHPLYVDGVYDSTGSKACLLKVKI